MHVWQAYQPEFIGSIANYFMVLDVDRVLDITVKAVAA